MMEGLAELAPPYVAYIGKASTEATATFNFAWFVRAESKVTER